MRKLALSIAGILIAGSAQAQYLLEYTSGIMTGEIIKDNTVTPLTAEIVGGFKVTDIGSLFKLTDVNFELVAAGNTYDINMGRGPWIAEDPYGNGIWACKGQSRCINLTVNDGKVTGAIINYDLFDRQSGVLNIDTYGVNIDYHSHGTVIAANQDTWPNQIPAGTWVNLTNKKTIQAPEFDFKQAISTFMLIALFVLVLRGKRDRNSLIN